MDFEFKNITLDCLDKLAKKTAGLLVCGNVLLLNGEIGSGKSQFCRYVFHHLGVKEEITSPTFCFMNEYIGKDDLKIYHFDLYRLKNAYQLDEIGFNEYGYAPYDGISFIEWADLFESEMPKNSLILKFVGNGDNPRDIFASASDEIHIKLLEEMVK